ncbi:GNAT family N-acetyltransferase [Flavobacterium frigoris]|uniref:GNAT family acetyltransferase n=1 Tax=Flavobacterium frigoris (strain PS1) TaxID=1086011 RepID=H7FS27_FLAFP|nr:GNAT family N-acetyltransferase [Flavobacterium frigoris]EIA08455.1 GNAT family acetyltransferase [Flavobacterium frigoris PS1]
MNFLPFPEIKTERLLLRKIEASDAPVILYLRSDETINQFIERPENRKTKTLEQALQFIAAINEDFQNNKSVTWGIAYNNQPHIIGTICLWSFSENNTIAEVGYGLNPEFQNKGIMTEVLKCVIDFGFNKLKLNKIEAFTHHKNENSRKLLEKCGLHFIQNRKDQDNDSNVIYELLNN